MIVGAGIIPLLVQFLHNRSPSRLQVSMRFLGMRGVDVAHATVDHFQDDYSH